MQRNESRGGIIITKTQKERAEAVLVGCAIGDALGAGYEFNPPISVNTEVYMKGGGPFKFLPGEWTDDTSMAVIIGKAIVSNQPKASARKELATETFNEIVKQWIDWSLVSKDVGAQTSRVLKATRHRYEDLEDVNISKVAFRSASDFTRFNQKSAGNGSLMRTAPVALAFLENPDQLWIESRRVSNLTHFDHITSEACQIWTAAIRHAVLTGDLDVRVGFDNLSDESKDFWSSIIKEAEEKHSYDFNKNGWVVQALQGAWSSIYHAKKDYSNPSEIFEYSVEYAVRGGYDTDTVAAITGSLVGASVTLEDIRKDWRESIFGYGVNKESGLVSLARDLIA